MVGRDTAYTKAVFGQINLKMATFLIIVKPLSCIAKEKK